MEPKDEIGRELKPSELKVNTVVVVKPPTPERFGSKEFYITVWVTVVDLEGKLVAFTAGVLRNTILNRITDEGIIVDDQDREVKVYEYLGEV